MEFYGLSSGWLVNFISLHWSSISCLLIIYCAWFCCKYFINSDYPDICQIACLIHIQYYSSTIYTDEIAPVLKHTYDSDVKPCYSAISLFDNPTIGYTIGPRNSQRTWNKQTGIRSGAWPPPSYDVTKTYRHIPPGHANKCVYSDVIIPQIALIKRWKNVVSLGIPICGSFDCM